MSRLKSLDSFVCTYCYNHPVERWWIDRRTIRAGLVSDGECVCLPSTPMIQHGKWKFGTVVPATQTRDQVFYFQWIIQCSQSSDFFSVIITPAFLIFFFQSKLPEEIKQGKCHLELHLHLKHFPKYKARWSKSALARKTGFLIWYWLWNFSWNVYWC